MIRPMERLPTREGDFDRLAPVCLSVDQGRRRIGRPRVVPQLPRSPVGDLGLDLAGAGDGLAVRPFGDVPPLPGRGLRTKEEERLLGDAQEWRARTFCARRPSKISRSASWCSVLCDLGR
jgi:hypothetical protein